jgi:3' terminal RNA ribose 2'-O-methyltransferase Hen1
MLLTLSTTHQPATDFGYLLHKNPARVHTRDLAFGTAHVVYAEATEERCTAALIVDVDPVGLVRGQSKRPRGRELTLGHYVNDRPYAASSMLSSAINKMYGTAIGGRSKDRPELAETAIPLEARLPVVPVRGGEDLVRRLFGPLGYELDVRAIPLDEQFPGWGASRYVDLRLRATCRLKDLLEHLVVLIPVLDDEKHYWVGADEVDKLLHRAGDWLATHPDHELITRRFLRHDRRLTEDALTRLLADVEDPDEADAELDEEEATVERPLSLNERRLASVIGEVQRANPRTVIDLGCGEGRLLGRLLKETKADRVVGVDVSHRSLERAALCLHLDTMAPRQRERIELLQGALTYRDSRIESFDVATVIEVVEHLDLPRLGAFERAVFASAQPKTVIVTTPNIEYNARFENLPAGALRHKDHRFEWTRAEFRDWATAVAERNGYSVDFASIGPDDLDVGSPTQMAVFTAGGPNR